MKTGESRGIILERGGKKLEGYNIPKFEILSTINFAHAAAPEQRHNPIPLGENSAGRKSPALWRVRA
jgi:hypothetical protein